MCMWKTELDPYIKVHRVSTSSFLPLIFEPLNLPPSIHVAVYLPTLGRESDFLDELAQLNVCIYDLKDTYPDAQIYLRGDFNVSKTNKNRTHLLNKFCYDHALSQVNIEHETYHHFLGQGSSDSHLDRLLYSDSSLPETLSAIHCGNENPLINSHHDLIVSEFSLTPLPQVDPSSVANIVAPRVQNTRTRILWTESGVVEYQELVEPHLQRIQELWLNPSSKSSMSMLLQSTNEIMSSAASTTNKAKPLNVNPPARSKKLPKSIRKSQHALLAMSRKVRSVTDPHSSHLSGLRTELSDLKTEHRKLERKHAAKESAERDRQLHSFLVGNSSQHFANIRRTKTNKAKSSIKKLTVNSKTYTGDAVPDGFYDSISNLKSLDLSMLKKSPGFAERLEDFQNILDICSSSEKIPAIMFHDAIRILDNLKPEVNDYFSITAKHYTNAGRSGYRHFFLLVNAFIEDLNSNTVSEINTASFLRAMARTRALTDLTVPSLHVHWLLKAWIPIFVN